MTEQDEAVDKARQALDVPGRKLLTLPAQFGSVRSTADNGASWNMRAAREVPEDMFILMSLFGKRRTEGHLVFVTDELDASQVEVPPEPARPKGKKAASASQVMRLRLENIANERGVDTEAYYQERMAKFNRELANELDDLRRDKHYESAGQF